MTDRELLQRSAMEQALEALWHGVKRLNHRGGTVECLPLHDAITALKAALAEPVQEPVYWEVRCTAHPKWMRVDEQQFDEYVSYGWEGQRLYTAPPQRPTAGATYSDVVSDGGMDPR